jgi:hypothetical protein
MAVSRYLVSSTIDRVAASERKYAAPLKPHITSVPAAELPEKSVGAKTSNICRHMRRPAVDTTHSDPPASMKRDSGPQQGELDSGR